jgi:adenylylsulfate kinase
MNPASQTHSPESASPREEGSIRGLILWFTGLSGSGKTTLSHAVTNEMGADCAVLDGDILRRGLCCDLGYGEADRLENMRRAAEVAAILAKTKPVVVAALISPLRRGRQLAREVAAREGIEFVEVFLDSGLETCERRDPKGLYKRARAGQIPEFTGITSPYEEPDHPELILHTGMESVEACQAKLVQFIRDKGLLRG